MSGQNIREHSFVEEEYDEIDFFALIRKFFSEWKLILCFCGVFAFLGILFSISMPKEYLACCKVNPESASASNSSMFGYASIASMSGLSLGMPNDINTLSPSLYPEVIVTNPFISDLFSLHFDFEEKGEINSMDYYEYIGLHIKHPWWKQIKSFPTQIIHGAVGIFSGKGTKKTLKGYEGLDLNNLTAEQLRIINEIKKLISVEKDKKTNLTLVSSRAQNPIVAAELNIALVDKLQEYVKNYKTEKARIDLEYYQQLCDDAKQEYMEAQHRYAKYMDANQGVVLQRVRIEQERLQNEAQLSYQIYSQCALQVQSAKAKLQEATPVFTILEPTSVPLRPCNKPIVFYIIIFSFLGFFFSAIWILLGRGLVLKLKSMPSTENSEIE